MVFGARRFHEVMQALIAQVRSPGAHDDGDVDDVHFLRHDAEPAIAARHQWPDVGAGESAVAHGLAAGLMELIDAVRNGHAIDVGRPLEPAKVVHAAEDAGSGGCVIGADAFEHRGAIVQRVAAHVHHTFGRLAELAVEPDASRITHGLETVI
jgi:hypothetical protein